MFWLYQIKCLICIGSFFLLSKGIASFRSERLKYSSSMSFLWSFTCICFPYERKQVVLTLEVMNLKNMGAWIGFGILGRFWQQFDWNYRPMAALCTVICSSICSMKFKMIIKLELQICIANNTRILLKNLDNKPLFWFFTPFYINKLVI